MLFSPLLGLVLMQNLFLHRRRGSSASSVVHLDRCVLESVGYTRALRVDSVGEEAWEASGSDSRSVAE